MRSRLSRCTRKVFESDEGRPRGAGLLEFKEEEYAIVGDYQGRLAAELQTHIASLVCEAARRAMEQNISPADAARAIGGPVATEPEVRFNARRRLRSPDRATAAVPRERPSPAV